MAYVMLYYLQDDDVKNHYFCYLQFFLYFQFMFKATQTFVDGHQLNQCGP